MKVSTDAIISVIDNIVDRFDTEGPEPAQIIIWSGPVPDSISDLVSLSSKTLAVIPFVNPAFGPAMIVDDVVEALAAMTETVSASDTGVAHFFRAYDRNGDAVLQGTVGSADEVDCDLNLNQTSITSGADVSIVRFAVGVPIA